MKIIDKRMKKLQTIQMQKFEQPMISSTIRSYRESMGVLMKRIFELKNYWMKLFSEKIEQHIHCEELMRIEKHWKNK